MVGSVMISVIYGDTTISDCNSVVLVPEIAITEPGYIKALTSNADSGAKHEFHALAQMAYYQFQDDELEVQNMHGSCTVYCRNETETIDSGVVILRNGSGKLNVLAHEDVNCKKLLEAANRYCTRWVRLDI